MSTTPGADVSEHERLAARLAAAEMERDYYRFVVERLGRKSLADTREFSKTIGHLKQAEALLRASEERYRLVTELSPSAIAIADVSGTVLMLNSKALALFGHADRSEAIGRSVLTWIPPASHEAVSVALQKLLREGSISLPELTVLRKDGSEFVGEIKASVLKDPLGHPTLLIILVSDLTERKQFEAERLKVHKLEAVGLLAGGIAHNFNNLLQAILSYISLAKLRIDDREKALAMLEQAESALNASARITGQLLTFAKGGKPVRTRLSLKPALESAAKAALCSSACNCNLEIAADLWPVSADRGQIEQAIQNIVRNADEAMPHGGAVEITAENRVLARGTHPSLPEGGRFVRIGIGDSGTGIPPKTLGRIFDPYFTTKQNGSGLGLATALSIVRNHGGTIDVASDPGKGCIFTVFLPALEVDASAEQGPAPGTGRPAKRILLMDDEQLVRDAAGEMLVALGFEVDKASDGASAVGKFREATGAGRPYEVVILDLMVNSGMGGEAAMREILKIDPKAVAVVSSGYSDSPVAANYRSYGFSASLSKPYHMQSLKECLSKISA